MLYTTCNCLGISINVNCIVYVQLKNGLESENSYGMPLQRKISQWIWLFPICGFRQRLYFCTERKGEDVFERNVIRHWLSRRSANFLIWCSFKLLMNERVNWSSFHRSVTESTLIKKNLPSSLYIPLQNDFLPIS